MPAFLLLNLILKAIFVGMNEYKKITLDNGLRLVLVPKASTEVLTTMIMFGVGSRYESESNAGISHVLEHMFFKGTEKRPTGLAISAFVDSIGGEYNAFTGKEYTGYYVKATPKHLDDSLDFLSDILLDSKFDPIELEKEKNVILEEINMYEDMPMEMVENYFEKSIFGKNALGRDIIGYRDTVKKTTAEDLIKYRNSHYTSKNAVIVLAGNFSEYSEEEIIQRITDHFKFSQETLVKAENIVVNQKKAYFLKKKDIEQSNLVIGMRTVPCNHPDHYKLLLLAIVLGGSASSRMFEEIREKRGLAYAVRSSVTNYTESGALITKAGVPHDKVVEAIRAIINEYKKVTEELISEEELNKAKEFINGKTLIKFEDSEELAYHYLIDEIVCHKMMTPSEIIKLLRSFTPKDLMIVAQKYFKNDNLGLAYIGRIELGKEISQLLKI